MHVPVGPTGRPRRTTRAPSPSTHDEVTMKILTHDLDHVSGGTAQYDAGHAIGSALRTAVDKFIEAGSLYTPIL